MYFSSLASLNLPAALDDVKNYKKCPESIREKSLKVKSNGGIDFINSKVKDLPLLYKKNEEILNEVINLVNILYLKNYFIGLSFIKRRKRK